MNDPRKRRLIMRSETPEIPNLFMGDSVEILEERWEGEEPFRRKKLRVRSLERRGVEGWVNETDVG
jgi:hypothetical protein